MIPMSEYVRRQMHKPGAISYGRVLGVTWFEFWTMLAAGRVVERNGEQVENPMGNGQLRIVVGGIITSIVGVWVALGGLLLSLLLILTLLLSPLIAFAAWGWSRWKARRLERALEADMNARVAAAKEAIK